MMVCFYSLLVSIAIFSLHAEKISLIDYLKEPQISPYIHEFVNIGYKNRYRHRPMGWDQIGGGRAKSWIQKTFDKDEETIVQEFSFLDPPQTWSLETIGNMLRYVEDKYGYVGQSKASIFLVKGVGVNGLHKAPSGKGAIVQLSSQFNYLESPGNYIVPVSDYLFEKKQGPQCAIEAAAATLHRYAMVAYEKLPHAFSAMYKAMEEEDNIMA